MTTIRRGEVWWIDFNPSIAGEIQKVRPAVIVSNDYSNQFLNRVQVIPLTSKVDKCYPCEALVYVESKQSKVMADQLMTVSKQRLKSKIGTVSTKDLLLVEQAIKTQLAMI